MKVLKSQRLQAVLRDEKAAAQLRAYLATGSIHEPSTAFIETRDASGNPVQYRPQLVPVGRARPAFDTA